MKPPPRTQNFLEQFLSDLMEIFLYLNSVQRRMCIVYYTIIHYRILISSILLLIMYTYKYALYWPKQMF